MIDGRCCGEVGQDCLDAGPVLMDEPADPAQPAPFGERAHPRTAFAAGHVSADQRVPRITQMSRLTRSQGVLPAALDVVLSSYPFSSFFSSLRNRQSVPWARIFWGLDLIIPTSRRRRA
jgi:hypothetical protein